TQVIFFDYGDSKLIFEVRGLRTAAYRGASIGNVFHCRDGYVVVTSYSSAIAYDRDGHVAQRFNGARDHYTNFVECVRSRRAADHNAQPPEAPLPRPLCPLGTTSYRRGPSVPLEPRPDALNGDAAAIDPLARREEPLGDNGLPLNRLNITVGRRLTMNPST